MFVSNYILFYSSEDKGNLAKIIEAVKTNYNDRFEEVRRRFGCKVLLTSSKGSVTVAEQISFLQ